MRFFLIYFLLHILIYFVFRLQFLIWNWNSLKTLNLSDYLIAFLYGARFDLAALSALTGLFVLGWLWFDRFKSFKKVWFISFALLNGFFVLLNFGDSELLNFTARRFTKSSFVLFKEGGASNLITPYIPMAIMTLLVLVSYAYLQKFLFKKSIPTYSNQKKVSITVGVLILALIGSRGGLQVKPITYVDAKIFEQSYANNLVLNSTFTLLKSFGKPSVERIHFFDNEKMLSLLNAQNIKSQKIQASPKNINVVYIFLESFSKEYLDLQNPEATPYLNSLRKKSVDYAKAYANGRRSIEGVAALLSGIPALMEEPFINSEFSANQIIGLGTILSSHNYHTSFFHGAQNGSMHFDQFMKSVGIQNYYGKNEYPNKDDDDGTWGIYDEPYLQWACSKLTEFHEPFFTSIFTLSSHQPYNVPEKYKERFKDERLPILKSIQYADYSLEQFMKCAEKQKWFANTLFILTADHTGPEFKANSSFESRFQIPLVFYSAQTELLKNLDSQQYAQHIDVLPTLLETLQIPLLNKNYLARSLWQSGPKVIALYTDGHYQLVGEVKDETQQLKAIQQYFSEGLFDNRLYYPVK
jgi:phosphoglycerol transferase MdoB-like AlkP superfamily enzyme